jgi:hypothetical protein
MATKIEQAAYSCADEWRNNRGWQGNGDAYLLSEHPGDRSDLKARLGREPSAKEAAAFERTVRVRLGVTCA